MTTTRLNIRRGSYYDSVVLMQLQAALARLPGVEDAGVVMGTPANKDLLIQSGLHAAGLDDALPDDLIIVIRANDEATADSALGQVDSLLARRQSALDEQAYLPQSLEAAAKMLPEAQWVLISVPGRYAAGVARNALRLGKNVFLYSDNVSLEDEISLKRTAAEEGLLVMGPDCGTAIVNGVGLGFANRVRKGPIGLVGASGTGLQQVAARIHQLGSGVSQALGTGGRDLKEEVGAITAVQALDLLALDPETKVIVLISKPPSHNVADRLLARARASGKPVVVDFIGYAPKVEQDQRIIFTRSLDDAAEQAVRLAGGNIPSSDGKGAANHSAAKASRPFAAGQKYLRGLFSGGTLAYEALLILQEYLPGVYSNVPLHQRFRLENSLHSREHTIVDLGEDEFTVGRLHPMMDNTLRTQRMMQEAADPEVGVLLLDVVLGYGAHPDPASELAPAIEQARAKTPESGRHLEVIAVVVGTDEDPQDMAAQIERLREAGAHVETSNEAAVRRAGEIISSLGGSMNEVVAMTEDPYPARVEAQRFSEANAPTAAPVDLCVIHAPLTALNVGLESFTESLNAQGAQVLHVRWKPPAGGNDRMMNLLERMKAKSS